MKVISALGFDVPAWPFQPLRACFLTLAIIFTGLPVACKGALPPTTDPTAFFTNVGGRLLKSELGLDLNRLQVYPTNQYDAVVHRLLQVTANIYDATTNRDISGYPFVPSVFRPLFRRDTTGAIFIAGYREVTDASLADASHAPPMMDLQAGEGASIPALGTTFGTERQEPLVCGVPLVIGAKKGFPNFNEFSMQTCLFITRLLEFRRNASLPPGPVVQTNQMFAIGITNAFGLEAWNSYYDPFPRNLRLTAAVDMRAWITNELGITIWSNTVSQGTAADIPAGTWPGWTNVSAAGPSFALPWGATNGFVFLTNSSYIDQSPWFVPQPHFFVQGAGFYAPRWWLNLRTRLRCILVDADVHRIVDYVNIDQTETPLDIMGKLAEGANCGTVSPQTYPDLAAQWCANRVGGSDDASLPTYGVMNQIGIGLTGTENWNAFMLDPYAGSNAHKAVDFFRYNLKGWGPIYPEDQYLTFYKSNVFYAPFDPYRPIFIHTSWQANDPLVHHLASQLIALNTSPTNRVTFWPSNPALHNLGRINDRFEPWGGSPIGRSNPDIGPYDPAAKDPHAVRSDSWDFPASQPLSIGWIGSIHRGTPWQTIYLKSSNVVSWGWAAWVGAGDPAQALALQPTNDWRLASSLALLFNTKDPHALLSVNQPNAEAWTHVLDGFVALTNTGPGQVESVVISSSSPQAAATAAGLSAGKDAQGARLFRNVGDVFSVPELSFASPWFNRTNWITDAAYETIPAQLLSVLRPDPIGTITRFGDSLQLRFSGYDGYAYALEVSPDLYQWTGLSTNYPADGFFGFSELISPGPGARFYRARLLP